MARFCALLFTLILPTLVFADPVNGVIVRGLFDVRVKHEDGTLYRLTTRSNDVQRVLKLLETGDSIVATGSWNTVDSVAEVDLIDFVGLGRLLGLWNATNSPGLLQFKSYSDMNIYTYALQGSGSPIRNRRNFKYTLSPGFNGEWVMFLADDSTTQLGFLKLAETEATINLMNSQTGEVQNVLKLRKVGY